jgi:phosphoadenosine phosphosulfate reductase
MVMDNDECKKMIGNCLLKGTMVLHPIIDWTDEEVWEFIRAEQTPYCSLYDEGFARLGCIGCPMADRHRWEEFERWPQYFALYLRAFERMAQNREQRGKLNDKDALGWMAWWMECERDDPRLLSLIEITRMEAYL